ncbi:hypothetical protein RUM43_013831 [Polyplax serrata]|uniref:Uncharacterized protein n=1 Tax=Polyplax serrata TaxID=468196 RepID=A0AAN8S675_POLSC
MFVLKNGRRFFRQSYHLESRKILYSNLEVLESRKLKCLEKEDRAKNKEVFKLYFIENLFINKIDPKILEYPEIVSLKEVNTLNCNCDTAKALVASTELQPALLESKMKQNTRITNIKELQLSGFKVSVSQGGFGYQNLEFARMQEILSSDLCLSKVISENENFGVEIISKFGNDNQKGEYCTKLTSGEIMSCFAHSETNFNAPLEALSIGTKAVQLSNGNEYKISGEKSWVYNANNADIIIFSANVIKSHDEADKKDFTLFVVDKNMDGITVQKPIKKIGLNDLDVCTVSFNNLVIPSSCILGSVDEGDLVGRLYAAESMAYLVAGRMDTFENPDTFLESLTLKIFSSETLQNILRTTLDITDGDFYFDCNKSLKDIVDDCHILLGCDYTNDYLRHILSSTGFKYVLNKKYKYIMSKFKKSAYNIQQKLISEYICSGNGELKCYLHLLLQNQSFILEDMVYRLDACTAYLLYKYGEEIYTQYTELNLMADLVIDIYATAAMLGRASRAYCLGVRRQELDRSIAECETSRIYHLFKKRVELIQTDIYTEKLNKIGSDVLIIKKNIYLQKTNNDNAVTKSGKRFGFCKILYA